MAIDGVSSQLPDPKYIRVLEKKINKQDQAIIKLQQQMKTLLGQAGR